MSSRWHALHVYSQNYGIWGLPRPSHSQWKAACGLCGTCPWPVLNTPALETVTAITYPLILVTFLFQATLSDSILSSLLLTQRIVRESHTSRIPHSHRQVRMSFTLFYLSILEALDELPSHLSQIYVAIYGATVTQTDAIACYCNLATYRDSVPAGVRWVNYWIDMAMCVASLLAIGASF